MSHDDGTRLVPSKPSDFDPSRYRLDPASRRLLDLVDGARDVASLAAAIGEQEAAVRSRLEMLGRAGLVTLQAMAAPGSSPAPEKAPPSAPTLPARESLEIPWATLPASPLSAKPPRALLDELARSGFGGAVRFEAGADAVEVFFDGGHAIGVRSSCPRHDLGEMLHAAARIDGKTSAAYAGAMERGAGHPVAALRGAGIEDRADLARHLAWHGAAILSEVAKWKEGFARIAAGAAIPPGVVKVRIALEAHGAHADWRDGPLTAGEEAFIEGNLSKYLVVDPRSGKALAAMGLGEREARYVRHLASSPKQLREALAISTLYRSPTRKLLCALVGAGVFALHDTNPEGESEIPMDELERYAERLSRENHFNVLAAHPSSTAREIEERYRARRAQFADARFPNAEEAHRRALEAIRTRFDEAFRTLEDAESRREYRTRTYEKEQLDNFFELQRAKAETVLKMRCDAAGALEIAESALELKPGEPEASLIAATALAQLNRPADARRALAGVKAFPSHLTNDIAALRRKLGG